MDSMFVEPAVRDSADYREFWARLNRGEFQAAQYKRIGKGGKRSLDRGVLQSDLRCQGQAGQGHQVRHRHHRAKDPKHGRRRQDRGDQPRPGRDRIQHGRHHRHREREFPRRDGLFARRDSRQASQHVRHAGRSRQRGLSRILGQASIAASIQAAEYKRIGKGGKEVWILATYNPILDEAGKPFKVVKFATDVTEQKLKNADSDGQIAAIGKSQAVIEFNMDGTIRTANQNFLNAMGYALSRSRASITACSSSPRAQRAAYREFWAEPQSRPVPGRGIQADRQGRQAKSGSRPPTTRSSISTASRSRW
jgi:methyl-accepting chemotaxis protein